MNRKKMILKYIQDAYADTTQPDDADQGMSSGSNDFRKEILHEMFNGMSSGTARIVIEREMHRSLDEEFNIKQLENLGRYYVARIVRHDGTTIQRLLVDKQTGNVRLV